MILGKAIFHACFGGWGGGVKTSGGKVLNFELLEIELLGGSNMT